MESPERQQIRRALDALKPYLRSYVEQRLAASSRPAPIAPVASGQPGWNPDIYELLKIMIDRWNDVFVRELSTALRSYIHELRDVRNRWAHEAPFTKAEVRRAVDTVSLIAESIGAPIFDSSVLEVAAATPPVASSGAAVANHVVIADPVMLFRISRTYKAGMSDLALYEATRGVWKLNDRRKSALFAMPVFEGVVKEVFNIERWLAAGSTEYSTRMEASVRVVGRWEFIGTKAETAVRARYVGKSVASYFVRGDLNPVAYVNCP